MKKITTLLVAFLIIASFSVHAQGEKPKSPPKEAKGKIGNVEVKINYSSPATRDRGIYGELVKFGKVWRAGANEATTIEFSDAVNINGSKLKAGTYSFFVIPTEEANWEVIFNQEAEQWGAYKLERSKDALVSESPTSKIDKVENLTYSIDEGYIHLDWDTTRLSIKVN
jgi:hypothetical protein